MALSRRVSFFCHRLTLLFAIVVTKNTIAHKNTLAAALGGQSNKCKHNCPVISRAATSGDSLSLSPHTPIAIRDGGKTFFNWCKCEISQQIKSGNVRACCKSRRRPPLSTRPATNCILLERQFAIKRRVPTAIQQIRTWKSRLIDFWCDLLLSVALFSSNETWASATRLIYRCRSSRYANAREHFEEQRRRKKTAAAFRSHWFSQLCWTTNEYAFAWDSLCRRGKPAMSCRICPASLARRHDICTDAPATTTTWMCAGVPQRLICRRSHTRARREWQEQNEYQSSLILFIIDSSYPDSDHTLACSCSHSVNVYN